MKTTHKKALLGALLGLLLTGSAGCGGLPRSPSSVAIALDPANPEQVTIRWDPASVPVERTEVTVSGGKAVTVTIQFAPN